MIPLLVTLSLVAGAPRGLSMKDPVDLATQVEAKLPQWLTGGGDLKALLANQKELTEQIKSFGVSPADAKNMAERALEDQKRRPSKTSFTATMGLVEKGAHQVTVFFFDGESQCRTDFVVLANGRLVLMMAPTIDPGSPAAVVDGTHNKSALTAMEKKDGQWAQIELPKPPPPDCATLLKTAAKGLFMAEKSHFAEFDGYSNDLQKIGYDARQQGVSITFTSADAKGFAADVSMNGGVVRVTDATTDFRPSKPCAK